MSDYIKNDILDKIREILDRKSKQKFDWNDSLYEDLKNYLSIDERGQLGEEIIVNILKSNENFDIKYDSSVTDPTKGFDFICNSIKIEVKTATITSNNGMFQHEHMHSQRDFDAILFLDIAPNNIFLTAVKKEDIIWARKRTDGEDKQALHRRPNGDYKCDFNINHIKRNNMPKFRNFKTMEILKRNDVIKIVEYLL